ncbi:MAG: 50S ribosomal protein L28 [Candidatus Omnitrophica bacterium]|nr:50S ribosomal protein L28 [Candidatus Omnitrophota bacterium]
MSRTCDVCGKGPSAGSNISQRGLAKKKGGVGRRTTRVTKRRFLPNLQSVRAVINGQTKKIKICTGCLKGGKVQKAG